MYKRCYRYSIYAESNTVHFVRELLYITEDYSMCLNCNARCVVSGRRMAAGYSHKGCFFIPGKVGLVPIIDTIFRNKKP
jgi:hypothetical protein